MHYVYVIYSASIDRFYIGETEHFETRLKWHNDSKFKGSYTSITHDWRLYLLFELQNIAIARRMESYMKSQKSRKFIIGLKESEKKRNKLLKKFEEGHCPDILGN
jgi:putative endonuclease